jgi:hypothetical protein
MIAARARGAGNSAAAAAALPARPHCTTAKAAPCTEAAAAGAARGGCARATNDDLKFRAGLEVNVAARQRAEAAGARVPVPALRAVGRDVVVPAHADRDGLDLAGKAESVDAGGRKRGYRNGLSEAGSEGMGDERAAAGAGRPPTERRLIRPRSSRARATI